jgi:hypothetical protein
LSYKKKESKDPEKLVYPTLKNRETAEKLNEYLVWLKQESDTYNA